MSAQHQVGVATSRAAGALDGQERLKFLLGVGAVTVVVLVAVVGWARSARGHRGTSTRRANLLALANEMIPPEVLRKQPEARFTNLAPPAERRLWRRHGLMLLIAVCLPILGLVSMLSAGVEDSLSWVGDHSLLVIAIAAPIVVGFVVSQLRLATGSVDDRSELLGLSVVESPTVGLGWRAGTIKAVPVGGLVREGVRHGRPVQLSSSGGGGARAVTQTLVEACAPTARASSHDGRWVDVPPPWQSLDPGAGDVAIEAGPDGVLVRRTLHVSSSTLDVFEAELGDLRLAEQIAERAESAGDSARRGTGSTAPADGSSRP